MRATIRARVVFCMVVASTMLAGEVRGFDEKPGSRGATAWKLTGKVMDQMGQPVGGGIVTAADLRNEKRFKTTAKEDGTFEISLPEDMVSTAVEVRDDQGKRRGYALKVNHESARTTPFQVVLKPLQEVTIEVIDGEGKPVEGASVLAKQSYYPVLDVKTGADGIVRGLFADEVEGTEFVALKSKMGFDYFSTRLKNRVRGEKIEALPGRVHLKLDGTRPLRLQVVDGAMKPVVGVNFTLWQINRKSNKAYGGLMSINLAAMTNQEGIAEFDWIPADVESPLGVRCLSEEFAQPARQLALKPEQNDYPFTVLRKQMLRGRVLRPDGGPAANVSVQVRYELMGQQTYSTNAKTDVEGRFQIAVSGDSLFRAFAKEGDTLAVKTGVVNPDEKQQEEVVLTLVPGTVVRGRLTQGASKAPLKNKIVQAVPARVIAPPNQPGVGGQPRGRQMMSELSGESTKTDDEGRYRLVLMKGSWHLIDEFDSRHLEVLKIAGEKEIVHDLNVGWDDGVFAGSVIDPDGKPVSGATMRLYYSPRLGFQVRPVELKTDKEGKFRGTRRLVPSSVHITSADTKLAIIVDMKDDKELYRFQILEATSLRGKLVDEQGVAKGKTVVKYVGLLFTGTKQNYSPPELQGQTVTDDEGKFVIHGLPTGADWSISYELKRGQTKFVKTVSVIEPAEIDVGEIVVQEPQ